MTADRKIQIMTNHIKEQEAQGAGWPLLETLHDAYEALLLVEAWKVNYGDKELK